MRHSLRVATNGTLVGRLDYESLEDRYTFDYEQAWKQSMASFSLSPHIPHTGDEPSRPGAVHRFLENLLPEGRALEVASVMHQMSKDNVYGLIGALGHEPVGAFGFLPLENAQQDAAELEPVRREIPYEELSVRIRERDAIPFPVWDRRVRLSVAGYQDKLQVLLEGDRISLVDGALSSTHILKPESRSPNTPFMVANEHFCMTFAARLGLPGAPVRIMRIPEPILLIERFDRVVIRTPASREEVSAVQRVHIIDGCQALDLPSRFKYERNLGHTEHVRNIREGASFEKLFALQPYFERPAQARLFLLRWALLQFLIGNSDAHGKNLSFWIRRNRLIPAPMYDLVSINTYGGSEVVEQEMAMAYGDVFLLEEITPFALADFAQRIGMRASLVSREMTRMAASALALTAEVASSDVYVGDERDMVQRIGRFVYSQATKMLELAPHVPKVDRALL